MITDPWFSHWNHQLLDALFRLLPHSDTSVDAFDLVKSNPLFGTWFFAAFFYAYWAKDDEQQKERRILLVRTMVALGSAFLLTGVIRPWIHWPAPVLNPEFQQLFPRYMWGDGSWNCFPSHSTLAYFTVALGFWPQRRGLSIGLSLFALTCVSLPRVYLGGHYPIDILFSCVLGILALAAASQLQVPESIACWLVLRGRGTAPRDWLLFLWVFELGEGFRGTEFVAGCVHRLLR